MKWIAEQWVARSEYDPSLFYVIGRFGVGDGVVEYDIDGSSSELITHNPPVFQSLKKAQAWCKSNDQRLLKGSESHG